jgi:hypothetical protein
MAALIAISLKPAGRSFYEGGSGFYGFCEKDGYRTADFLFAVGFNTPPLAAVRFDDTNYMW